MANLIVTKGYADGAVLTKALLDTSFNDISTWLNNRDNGTDNWLNLSVAATVAIPVIITSSAATTTVKINNTAGPGNPKLSLQISGTEKIALYVDDSDNDYGKIANPSGTCLTVGQGAKWIGFAHGTASLPGIGVFDGTTNNKGFYGGTNTISIAISATGTMTWTGTTLEPVTDNTISLGKVSGGNKRWSDVRSVLINGADYGFANGWILREYPCNFDDVQTKSNEWMKSNANQGIQVINDIGEIVAIIGRDGTIKAKKFEVVTGF